MTCPSCGAANPARARFCATCGSALAAGRTFIGDAVVAFGVPVVREDDALRAVRAAAATQDAVADLGAGLEVRRNQGPLVGCRAELQRFDLVFQRGVQTSSRHLLTVLGAAGVGKTRLVATAVDALGEAATALFGHCPSDAGGSTFWPVAEIVRRAAEIKTADPPSRPGPRWTSCWPAPTTARSWPSASAASSGWRPPRCPPRTRPGRCGAAWRWWPGGGRWWWWWW